jgi:hypothetical protein
MSDNEKDSNEPVEPPEPVDSSEPPQPPAAAPAPVDAPPPPVAVTKPRWRDRVFRMRAVAAVAVAGVIIGAAGGAVTTALVSGDDHGDRNERFRIGPAWGPGMPAVPPGGRERFPGDEGEDGGLPEMPFPPGSESGTDDGTDQESLYQS